MITVSALLLGLLLLLPGLPGPGEAALYLPGDVGLELRLRHLPLEGVGPQALVDALVAGNALPVGVQVRSFREEAPAVLDLSREFREALNRTGSSGETMMVYSLANTFLVAYGLDSLTITCEGAVLETGHQIYDYPLKFCQACVDWGG